MPEAFRLSQLVASSINPAFDACAQKRMADFKFLRALGLLRDRFALNTQNFDEYDRLIGAGRLPINRVVVRSEEAQRRGAVILPLTNGAVPDNRQGAGGRDNEQVLTEARREVAPEFQSEQNMNDPRAAYASGPLCPNEAGRAEVASI